MRYLSLLTLLLISFAACQSQPETVIPAWRPYDESAMLVKNAEHENPRMQYKLIQSKVLDKNDIWKDVAKQIQYFSEEDYETLKPLIYEQDIPTIQSHIEAGNLTYEKLVQWYLYRIVKFENDSTKTLHTIISINPNAVEEARERDKQRSGNEHPVYGMPILLKDNINTTDMRTTAGALALKDNQTSDAFIVERIREKGGIIMGKVNLSEWAYFFCQGCPVGYSAVGGQTLNPYGRMIFESGGSSSGSGTSMAANYAVAAVGTETSGSILSPSSQNSVVGLKPTIGLLSRNGVVPISETLDTPGPMTRNVTDNAILLSAMVGEDPGDKATINTSTARDYWEELDKGSLKGLRLGVLKPFLEDSIYAATVKKLEERGAETIPFEPEAMSYEGFVTFLNVEMKEALPKYLETHASENISIRSVADVVDFNLKDTLVRMPYGQGIFDGIVAEDISEENFAALSTRFANESKNYFEKPMTEHSLDAVLSINNWSAGQAAFAQYPCLTVPMGYRESGEPVSLTFIGRPLQEEKLLKMGYAFEQATQVRKVPQNF